MNFRSIRFGKASAEAESATAPELLLAGYLDHEGFTSQATSKEVFLFLGYKGSGKTALGEHLKLSAARSPTLFARSAFLADFPFRTFQKIVSGSAEPEARFPTAWSWLLLVMLLDSFSKDQGISSAVTNDLENALRLLRGLGVLPANNLRDMVVTSSKRSFKINLPADFGFEVDSSPAAGEDLKFLHLVEHLKRIIFSIRSDAQHFLIIDGLDDILTEREVQYHSLAALITEAMRLNVEFAEKQAPAKIVVLCRTDLYERLPGPNKNKIRQDFAAELDWYHDPRKPQDSALYSLANLRARLVFPHMADVFQEVFPIELERSPTVTYFLEHTRHTPRDFLQLLVHLQKYWQGSRFTREQMLSGLRDYSIKYFLPEVKDELVGYLEPAGIEAVVRLFASLGKREFGFSELLAAQKRKEQYQAIDLESACDVLYECSALGHVDHSPSGSTRFAFKFRNRHSGFNPSRPILMHRGLWKAMNLV